MLRLLSLGAGVQSSVVLLMSEVGELPKLDGAIFADTGDEPDSVYRWLAWLQKECSTPIHVVSRGYSISRHVLERIEKGDRLDSPPFYTMGGDGRHSICMRDCTREWKIKVIEKQTRKLLGLKKGQRWPKELAVETWIGISWDEKRRAKVSTSKWQRFWHPLIEEPWGESKQPMWSASAMTRSGCLQWMSDHGYPEPPRSACWHCPFQGNAGWRRLRDEEPSNFQKAIELDESLREHGVHGMRQDVFLHRSLKPLRDVDLDDHQMNLFDDECSGICGV